MRYAIVGTTVLLLVAAAACPGESDGPAAEDIPAFGDAGHDVPPPPTLAERLCEGWTDHPDNPLIEPPGSQFLLGDPTVLLPAESPDGLWHLFANSLDGIHHYTSDDGVGWTHLEPPLFWFLSFRPYVFIEGGTFYLFFEQFDAGGGSKIFASTSADLYAWEEPVVVLEPELAWETSIQSTAGNPYVTRVGDEYWLYYSADGVEQADTGFAEPRHVGLARAAIANGPLGPYTKGAEPLISPSSDDPYRNMGAGSFKLFDERLDGWWIAFNNGIYHDAQGQSRSAIMVIRSADGLAWEDICPEPIIAPSGDGWKSAFVYAFDTVRVGDEVWLYYNARDGWEQGSERIGMARLRLPLEEAGR